MEKEAEDKIASRKHFNLSGNAVKLRSCKSIAIAVCVFLAMSGATSASAGEVSATGGVSDLKLQIEELQRQNEATSQKLKELQAIMEKALKEQKPATVAPDAATAQKIESIEKRQDALEEKATKAEKTASTFLGIQKGDFPKSFKAWGDTSVRIGGIVITDAQYDIGPSGGPAESTGSIPVGPTARKQGTWRWQDLGTRLLMDVRKPTQWGVVRAYIESDFGASANSYSPTAKVSTTVGEPMALNAFTVRLRYAYLKFGNWQIGQADTTFLDYQSLQFFIDQTGPTGLSKVRQPLVRYTIPLGSQTGKENAGYTNPFSSDVNESTMALQFALEDPHGDWTQSNGVTSTSLSGNAYDTSASDYPDMFGKFIIDKGWGRFTVAGMYRRIRVDDGLGHSTATNGWGENTTALFSMNRLASWFGNDRVTATLAYGRGVGRYITDDMNDGAAAMMNSTNTYVTRFEPMTQYSTTFAYTHWWLNGVLSSALGLGRVHNDIVYDFPTAYLQKNLESFHLNLLWRPTPVPGLILGTEYIWGERQIGNGQDGTFRRIQFSCLYFF